MFTHIHTHTSLAHKNGYFEAELAPLEVKVRKAKEMFASDEHPRETSLEKLATLPPVFKENGTVSAGNASVRAIARFMMLMPWIGVYTMATIVLVSLPRYSFHHVQVYFRWPFQFVS